MRAPGAYRREPTGIGHPFGPSLRSAPSRGRKRHALRRRGRAKQRPVGVSGCWMFGCPTHCGLRLRRGGGGGGGGGGAPPRRRAPPGGGGRGGAAQQKAAPPPPPPPPPAAGLPLR